jgi:hypothetical protein
MKTFAQAAFRNGLPFGAAMGVFFFIQHPGPAAIVGGLVAGLPFGVAMALYQRRGERRLQKLGVSAGDMKPTQERTISLSVDVNVAIEKAKAALVAIRKMRLDSIKADGSRITATTGMTWQSFGEHICVDILADVAGATVRVGSRPRGFTSTMDGGKGRENVELFTKALTE